MPEPNRQALLIANARYSDQALSSLCGTEVDVKALEAVLTDPAIGGYNVQTAIDEPVHKLRQHIERFFSQASRDSLLLLYLSGHGVKDRDGKLYFASTDTDSNLLMSTGLAANFIQESSEHSRCRRQVFVLDACFSGAFARGYSHKSGQRAYAQEPFSGGTGKIIITASDDIQYALVEDEIEGSAAASVFTRHFVEGLRTGAAANDAELITADRLYQYVYEHVIEDNPAQRPQFWSFGLNGDLILARNPVPKPIKPFDESAPVYAPAQLSDPVGQIKPKKLPAEIIDFLEDSKSNMRLQGIIELEALLAETVFHEHIDLALKKLIHDDSKTVSARAVEVQDKFHKLKEDIERKRQFEAEAKRKAAAKAKRRAALQRLLFFIRKATPIIAILIILIAVFYIYRIWPEKPQPLHIDTKSNDPENTVAIVNGKPISRASVQSLKTDVQKNDDKQEVSDDKVIEVLISRELLRQEAEKLNLVESRLQQEVERQNLVKNPQLAARLENASRDVLAQAAVENFRKNIVVTDEEVRKEYDARIASADLTEYKARHILVETEQKANDILARLKKGEKFADLAKKLSKDPSAKQNGGDLGWFNPQQMVPEFSAAVAGLQNGEIAPAPVQSKFGWHVIQREDSRKSEPPAFDAVKEQIRNVLIAQKLQQHVEDLKKAAKIENSVSKK